METYFQGFHEDEQFSTNLLLSNVDEVMKDQFAGLESTQIQENISWGEENIESQHVGKDDFQKIMLDWQQQIGSLQSADNEDIGLGLGLDTNLDILNTYSNTDLFGDLSSPILSKALKYPGQKYAVNIQPLSKSLAPVINKDSFFENLAGCNVPPNNNQKLCGLIKIEPNLIRKVTLINGEKEILGKNIIGLHCLNEIKENPDENCQVTSTVINGKRYKVIIKPKSLKVKKLSEEKIRKTLIKKLMQCHIKTEPKQDEITSEMCNGNYDVPILNSDLLPSWEFAALDCEWSSQESKETDGIIKETELESEKKVPPLRLKIPKIKKCKKKSSVKSDEEIDVESISGEEIENYSLGTLLKNFEDEVARLEKNESEAHQNCHVANDDGKTSQALLGLTSENIKKILPKEMIDKIEALKRKKECRIPLIQAIPTRKSAKNVTRMQDAVATMNRNKLLKIVSGGDSVQMDHDYCSTFTRTSFTNKVLKKNIRLLTNLEEKNPKKDSGMESGDVSDASEGPNTPDNLQNSQSLRQLNSKVLEDHRRVGDHSGVTKAAVAFFRASNAAAVNENTNGSDFVKTKTVSNGNKALTNDLKKSDCSSDSNNTVPSDYNIKNKDDIESNTVGAETQKNANDCPTEQRLFVHSERPKKKLKLEEYLNRRHLKEKEGEKNINNCIVNDEMVKNTDLMKSAQGIKAGKFNEKEISDKNTQEKSKKNQCSAGENEMIKENTDKKYWRSQSRSSSSASSEERNRRERRRRSRSKSRFCWRSGSNSSDSRRLEGRGRNRYSGRSESCDKKLKGVHSDPLSRSSSRDSSTSSDYSDHEHRRNFFTRYRRRSRSRSVSRDRSGSRNRGYKRRHSGNYCYNRNFNNRRSKSPFYAYSMREKQRQIEERRVIYVGRIEEGMTNAKLRERFSIFGPIIDISLHFREYGDNYGFVTYAYKADAYDAVEHGNDDSSLPHYDLCFGGRRGFCKEKYADLDGMPTSYSGFNDTPFVRNAKESFDLLLKEAQAKLKSRKKITG